MKQGYKQSLAHPCSLCGQPTRSAFPVCDRPGSCHAEYTRAQRQENPARRNATAMRYHRKQKGAPSVYGIWFPSPQVLKVGFTLNTSSARFVGAARPRAELRGWDTEGSSCIWREPGDTRVEAWMQATLAFRWRRTYEQGTRLCEWFLVPGLTEEEIVRVLDEVYRLVPADLVDDTSVVQPLVIEEESSGVPF